MCDCPGIENELFRKLIPTNIATMALMVEARGDLREMVIRLMEGGLMGCMMGGVWGWVETTR